MGNGADFFSRDEKVDGQNMYLWNQPELLTVLKVI